jgi:hypothetical protein
MLPAELFDRSTSLNLDLPNLPPSRSAVNEIGRNNPAFRAECVPTPPVF